jgi:hypothetical protein
VPTFAVILSRFRKIATLPRAVQVAALPCCALFLFVTGCRREDIRVYEAPKEKRASRVAAPEGWEEQPAGQMSVSSYLIRGAGGAKAQVTVTALPASAKSKDEVANVNMWRSQVALKEIEVDQVERERERIQIAGHAAALFDMSGTMDSAPTRILAAMQNRGDAVWFFKMTGDDALVKSQKDAFVQFAAGYPLPHDHNHDGHGNPTAAGSATGDPNENQTVAATTPSPSRESSPEGQGRFRAPPGWEAQPPGAMQDARFLAANGKATVTISIFENSGGELRPNVDRWRGQIALKPATDEEFAKSVAPLDLPEGKATIVDMTGPQQRLVTVIVARGSQSWYFKLTGEPAAVGAEKNKLIEFVKTTK